MPRAPLATPFPVFPGTADTLIVDNLTGYPPSYRWELAESISAQGMETAPHTKLLVQGNGTFTTDEWRDWRCENADDDKYILSIVCKHLNLKTL